MILGIGLKKGKKAAPRFELGIKDLQSSALPLGHAAVKKIERLSTDSISQGNQNVLFLSNGHGEDLIALRVLEELHKIYPSLFFEVLPLVGEGKMFEDAIKKNWVVKLGPSQYLPSGGFSNQSLLGLLSDLLSGLISLTYKQWAYIRRAGKNGRTIIAIGDLLPLFFAWSSGGSFGFIGTPKSDYTWISGPGFSLSDAYHRLKGTEWDPWELALMQSSRCKMVAVRDKLTARGLRRKGVNAIAPGNPMMDGLSKAHCPETLHGFRRLILLCGSRMPEAENNFRRLIKSLDLLEIKQQLAILVATGAEPSLELLEGILKDNGYQNSLFSTKELGAKSCWSKGSRLVFLGSGCFSNWAIWGEVGLANAGTATEQLVGLGIPCVSLPGNGPQFNYGFASRQSRLLGGSVVLCKSPQILAQMVELLLRDEQFRKKLSSFGQKRMGIKGGSFALACLISRLFDT